MIPALRTRNGGEIPGAHLLAGRAWESRREAGMNEVPPSQEAARAVAHVTPAWCHTPVAGGV